MRSPLVPAVFNTSLALISITLTLIAKAVRILINEIKTKYTLTATEQNRTIVAKSARIVYTSVHTSASELRTG